MPPVPVSSIPVPTDRSAPDRSAPHGSFRWSCEPDWPDSLRLQLVGELDLDGIEELRLALLAAEDPARLLIVDLAGLDFIDCAATACLFRVAVHLFRTGRRVLLAGGHGQVARLLDLTGIPPGVEQLPDVPHLRLASGPRARAGSSASSEGVGVAF
jgi:anti-anti-sigma factor